jgi:hypothetical protein
MERRLLVVLSRFDFTSDGIFYSKILLIDSAPSKSAPPDHRIHPWHTCRLEIGGMATGPSIGAH